VAVRDDLGTFRRTDERADLLRRERLTRRLEERTDLEGRADLSGAAGLARTEAAAAVCAWLGASVLRTRHVAKVRRCADMTESILGRRPPAWAVRGLA